MSPKLALTAALLLALASPARAWRGPILVTPDSGANRNSRIVVDGSGNLHAFYISDRYQQSPPPTCWDVFYCKMTPEGIHLTEDVRLDSSRSNDYDIYPSPLLGTDNKLHVAWAEAASYYDPRGIYYARLDTNGHVERYATLIFPDITPQDAKLFQDSEGFLDVVWIRYDSLFFGKFDSSGQVIMPRTLVFEEHTYGIYHLEACMDANDQIHCTYRHDWGFWDRQNLGYSRVTSQGQVQVAYAPLTPEVDGMMCAQGYITADDAGDLHLNYRFDESGSRHQYYRKVNQNLETLYHIRLTDSQLNYSGTGYGDIALNCEGNIVLTYTYNCQGSVFQYKRASYTIQGEEIIAPETIISNEDEAIMYPDLSTGLSGMIIFDYTGTIDSLVGTRIFYCLNQDHLGVGPGKNLYLSPSPHVLLYPNPFNESTRLHFELPHAARVTLGVFDLMGRNVGALLAAPLTGGAQSRAGQALPLQDLWLPAGAHEVIFDGSGLPSGVYLARLAAGESVAVKKLVLLK